MDDLWHSPYLAPLLPCASWLRLGTFSQVVWEKYSCRVQELERGTYASCQAFTGYELKASQKQNALKNDWKDPFALTDGKHQRLGKCICVCMHICVNLCEFTHTPTQAFAKGVVNKFRKFFWVCWASLLPMLCFLRSQFSLTNNNCRYFLTVFNAWGWGFPPVLTNVYCRSL